MKILNFIYGICALCLFSGVINAQSKIPHLNKQGTATQLIVDNHPFLILGGELGNSTASTLSDLDSIFPKLKQMNLNTVLTPAYWDLIEPTEGQFDFSWIDYTIEKARANDLKIVFLWFASWKNSMSCYAPVWVKENYKKYPRARTKEGKPLEIMSTFYKSNCEADKKAFIELMKHIAKVDSEHHTVIMMQVENEIGMLEDARDYSDEANKRFNAPVPQQLIDYMNANKNSLHPVFNERWKANGAKTKGNWTELFGASLETDEIFMAYYYGLYMEEIISAGKKIYNIPMFLNAALNSRGRKPGAYPSAGPLAHLMDLWRAAAPSNDILAPDIYDLGFAEWCRQYHFNGNPLLIPETTSANESAVRLLYVLGKHDAMGFSPFGIEYVPNPADFQLGKSYALVNQLMPLITEKQGTGKMYGFLLDDSHQEDSITLGKYRLKAQHIFLTQRVVPTTENKWPETGVLVMQLSENEYLVAGRGVAVTFANARDKSMIAGIGYIDRVEFINGKMTPNRRNSGDQSHQGRHLRVDLRDLNIQYVKLYDYK